MIDLFSSSSGCGRYDQQQMHYKLQSPGSVTSISGKTTAAETQVFFSTNASNNLCLMCILFYWMISLARWVGWCNTTVLVCNLFLWLTGLYVNRMVNTCLAEEMKEIHAFEQKTLTPEQWDKQNTQWHPYYFHLNKRCISDMEQAYKLNSSGNHAVDHSVAIIKRLYGVFWRLFEYFPSQKVNMSFITEIVEISSKQYKIDNLK